VYRYIAVLAWRPHRLTADAGRARCGDDHLGAFFLDQVLPNHAKVGSTRCDLLGYAVIPSEE
jgi:hypothetical protein